jgi:hypothetical protein
MRVGAIAGRRETCCRYVMGALGLALLVLGGVGIAFSQKNRLRLGLSSGAVVAGTGVLAASTFFSPRRLGQFRTLAEEEADYQARVAAVGAERAERDLSQAAARMLMRYSPLARGDTEEARVLYQVAARRALLQDMARQSADARAVGTTTLTLIIQQFEEPVGEARADRTDEARASESRRVAHEQILVMERLLADPGWQLDDNLSREIRIYACMNCLNGVVRTSLQGRSYGELLARWSVDQDMLFHGAVVNFVLCGAPGSKMAQLLREWAGHLPQGHAAREVILGSIPKEVEQ